MENTQKGYIVPLVMIVLLLGLAGYFLFAGEPVESPIVEQAPTTQTQAPVVPRPNPTDTGSTTDEDDGDEPIATTTASTTVDIEAGLE